MDCITSYNSAYSRGELSILDKLKDLGYVEDDFPRDDPKEWTKIVYQPKVLTDRST